MRKFLIALFSSWPHDIVSDNLNPPSLSCTYDLASQLLPLSIFVPILDISDLSRKILSMSPECFATVYVMRQPLSRSTLNKKTKLVKSGAKDSFGEACYLLGSIFRVKLDLQSHKGLD